MNIYMNTLRVSIIEAGKGSEIIVTVIVTNNNLYLELLRRGQAPSIVINNKYFHTLNLKYFQVLVIYKSSFCINLPILGRLYNIAQCV